MLMPTSNQTCCASEKTRIALAGDFVLSSAALRARLAKEPKSILRWLGTFAPYLDRADAVFANFEGCIYQKSRPLDKNLPSQFTIGYSHAEAEFLSSLPSLTLSLANNHIADYGSDGIDETVAFLDAHAIPHTGIKHGTDATQPLLLDLNSTKIAFLAFTDILPKRFFEASDTRTISSCNSPKKMQEAIHKARRAADVVIVSLHTIEKILAPFSFFPDRHQQNMSRIAADAGANIVFGHQPHGLQFFERYKRSLIFHSLGPLVYDPSLPDTIKDPAFKACTKIFGGGIAMIELCRHHGLSATVFPTRTIADRQDEYRLVPAKKFSRFLPAICNTLIGNPFSR